VCVHLQPHALASLPHARHRQRGDGVPRAHEQGNLHRVSHRATASLSRVYSPAPVSQFDRPPAEGRGFEARPWYQEAEKQEPKWTSKKGS
jgi:hypothetical protein